MFDYYHADARNPLTYKRFLLRLPQKQIKKKNYMLILEIHLIKEKCYFDIYILIPT